MGKATTNSYVRPVIAGTYYLNPSSATKEQIKKITVLSADKEYINKTRAAASNPEVESYEVKDGVLTVYFKATTELIEAISSSKITVLAIRVETEAGNTITDEYRAIYATDYENVILGDKAKKLQLLHNITCMEQPLVRQMMLSRLTQTMKLLITQLPVSILLTKLLLVMMTWLLIKQI